jgi:hypothetical protein
MEGGVEGMAGRGNLEGRGRIEEISARIGDRDAR